MKNLCISAALIWLAAQIGCDKGTTTEPPGGEASVEITPAAIDTLFSLGDSVRLSAVVKDGAGTVITNATVSFESLAPDVVTVSSEGIAVSMANGEAIITAQAEIASASVPIRVRQRLATVLLAAPTFRLGVGGTTTLSAAPADARGAVMSGLPDPTYSSANSGVATVSTTGLITGVKPGTAVVTAAVASAADGPRTGTAEIAIITIQSEATVAMGSTTFSPAEVDIERGGTVNFDNHSGIPHDVDFGRPDLNIAIHSSGRNTRHFPEPGTFSYHCNIHSGMTGTVFVH